VSSATVGRLSLRGVALVYLLVVLIGPVAIVGWRMFDNGAGHVYGPLQTATDRAGYVLATGPDRAQALRRAAAAVDAVSFEVR